MRLQCRICCEQHSALTPTQIYGKQADAGELHRHDWATDPATCSRLDRELPEANHPVYDDALLALPHWGSKLHLSGSETAMAGGGYMEGALASAGRVRRALNLGAPIAKNPIAATPQGEVRDS